MTPSTQPLAATPEDTLQSALTARSRPAHPTALSASLTFASRTLLKIKHVPEQVFDVIAIPVVFTLLFTFLFGGALAGSTADYLQDLLPGTLVMAVVLLSTFTVVGLTTDLASGAFDRFRTLPIWPPAPLVGALFGDLGRYLIAATLVLLLGLAMGFRPQGGAIGVAAAVALALLFGYSLSWVWTAVGLVVRTPSAVNSISLAVLFPLTLASNTFVDPRDHAALAAGRRRCEPDHSPRDGDPGTDARPRQHHPGQPGAGGSHRDHRRVRPPEPCTCTAPGAEAILRAVGSCERWPGQLLFVPQGSRGGARGPNVSVADSGNAPAGSRGYW